MAQHDNLISAIQDQAIRFLRRVDELKTFLALVRAKPADRISWASETQDARALAMMCTMAELEALVRFVIQETHKELNNSSIRVHKLIPQVRQLVAHTEFESLRTINDSQKLWERRSYATTMESCAEIANFPVERSHPQPPLDGKTLKPEHFHRIWSVYALPGTPFARIEWTASLQKLALARNDIAHGNLPYFEIFQQAGRSLQDVENYVGNVGDIATHFVDTWCTYLQKRMYLVP